jgi:hypothetical protein
MWRRSPRVSDPTLAQHVAELADTVENHGLLLARLLENE